MRRTAKPFFLIVTILLVLGSQSFRLALAGQTGGGLEAETGELRIYLPLISQRWPRSSPFGVEFFHHLSAGSQLQHYIREFGGQWVRINYRISWQALQPDENGPIHWEKLNAFEAEMRQIQALGLTPVIVVDEHPAWAVKPARNAIGATVYPSCAAIRSDQLTAFAGFMQQLAQRYSQAPYHIHHWEIGNEPDIDPSLVAVDSHYGCWGDKTDPFYGGRHYGEMLKIVTPAVKQVDPQAKIWIGGLLLDSPSTAVTAGEGQPEMFLQGILEAGAAAYFDILAYHAYPDYQNKRVDADLMANGKWSSWGGLVLGKVRFLRAVLQAYGAEKPVYLNEISITCSEKAPFCNPPGSAFYQAQAEQLVRSLVRGLSAKIQGIIWYSLEDPGWRHAGLLDAEQSPKPAYYAYQQLAKQLQDVHFEGDANYGPGLEAYAFRSPGGAVHVVWAREEQDLRLSVPQSEFVAAYDLFGQPLDCQHSGDRCQIGVGFAPVYLLLGR